MPSGQGPYPTALITGGLPALAWLPQRLHHRRGHDGETCELTAAEVLTGAQIAQKIAAAIGGP
jgi:hypothetical protein